MRTLRNIMAAVFTASIALTLWSCDEDVNVESNVEIPTIGIMEPEFDSKTMNVKVMIAPSSDTTAWYWCVDDLNSGTDKPAEYTREEGAAAKEIEFKAIYGVEYTISAYAENKAGKSEVATKKFCAMPEGEVSVTIGEITLNKETMIAEATIYPSKAVTAWYWQSYVAGSDNSTLDWNAEEGNTEKVISFEYTWSETYELRVYAECGELTSEIATTECMFEPEIPTLRVGDPIFDDKTMTLSFKVTPSEDTDHWYWGLYDDALDAKYETYEDNEPRTVSCKIEYDKQYQFIFRVENALNKGNEEIVDFYVLGDVADITISNLTAFTVDALIEKSDVCVRYVAGALHTSAYDRNVFIEEAQSSLNPDPSYPFAVFNSATDDRTFSEQDLVRNSRTDSNENAGIMLLPGVSYTIAVYGEDKDGNYNVTTAEFVVPKAEINGNIGVEIEMAEVTDNSATAKVTATEECKMLIGLIDPAVAMADTENPFDIEGKSDEEIKAYIVSIAHAVPTIYNAPITRMIGEHLEVGSDYVAYALAIKDGKIGQVEYVKFKTTRPTLSGIAKITAAEIVPQDTHETLTVKVTADSNAQKVRLYAAPTADHDAYADNMEGVMDADTYQNYREEYELVDGMATATINIYHPGDNYYIYASAVDTTGRAGEMVCVAQLAGYDTEYYTTMEEIIDDGTLSFAGTGTAKLTASDISEVDERVNVTLTATEFSSNVDKVWFMRLASCKTEDIESRVKDNLKEYAETGKIMGSYKIVKEDWAYKYVDDLNNSFDPKYDALLKYSTSYGGDIVVMVILDTNGRVNIHSYFAGGLGVKEFVAEE